MNRSDQVDKKPLTEQEKRNRYERECAKLDPEEEQAMAEEGMVGLDEDY